MSSAYEKTAQEHAVLSGLESYIEEVVEYSDTILDIHNDIMDNKLKFKNELDLLRTELKELKDAIEDLIKEKG